MSSVDLIPNGGSNHRREATLESHRRGKHGGGSLGSGETRMHRVSKHTHPWRGGESHGCGWGVLNPVRSNIKGWNRAWLRRMEEKKLAARKIRKKKQPRRRTEMRRKAATAAAKATARMKMRKGELSIGTFNVRTLAYKGKRPVGHNPMTAIQICAEAGCDVVGLQETRREGQGCIEQGEYVIMWSGARAGTKDKKGVHGVALAIKRDMWDGVKEEDRTVECISPRLMKVRLQLGPNCGVAFVVGYAPTEVVRGNNRGIPSRKDPFWNALNEAIREVPHRDHVVVMIDTNARTGERDH